MINTSLKPTTFGVPHAKPTQRSRSSTLRLTAWTTLIDVKVPRSTFNQVGNIVHHGAVAFRVYSKDVCSHTRPWNAVDLVAHVPHFIWLAGHGCIVAGSLELIAPSYGLPSVAVIGVDHKRGITDAHVRGEFATNEQFPLRCDRIHTL